MNIPINSHTRITSDKLNYILEELERPEGSKRRQWVEKRFYDTLAEAVKDCAAQQIRLVDAAGMNAILTAIEHLEQALVDALLERPRYVPTLFDEEVQSA